MSIESPPQPVALPYAIFPQEDKTNRPAARAQRMANGFTVCLAMIAWAVVAANTPGGRTYFMVR